MQLAHFVGALVAFTALALGTDATIHSSTVIPVSCSSAIDPTQSCSSVIRAAIAACRNAPSTSCGIDLEPGVYIVAPPKPGTGSVHAIDFANLNNVSLRGAGSNLTTIVVTDVSHLVGVTSCRNFTASGFSVDMLRVPFTAGIVVNAAQGVVQIDTAQYAVSDSDQARYPWLLQAQALIGYDAKTERFLQPDVYRLQDPFPIQYVAQGGNGTSALMVIPKAPLPPVGAWVVVRHIVYAMNGFDVVNTQGVTVNDVRLWAAAGMGLYAANSRDITITKFEVRRKRDAVSGLARPLSINADGIHICDSVGGGVVVQDCVLEGQGDDGVNINTRFARIESIVVVNGSTTTIVGGQGSMGSAAGAAGLVWAGAILEFFDGQTMQPLGVSPPVSTVDYRSGTITFATASIGVPLYTLFVNANASADFTLVTNSTFLNNRARGALLKQPNVLCTHNRFSGCTLPAVLTQVDGCFWFEGRPVSNWTFANNVVSEVDSWGYGAAVSVHGEVPVFKNGQPTTQCVSIPGVAFGDVTCSNNTFIAAATTSQPGSRGEAAIRIYASQYAITTDNFIVANAPKCDIELINVGGFTNGRNFCKDANGASRNCTACSW